MVGESMTGWLLDSDPALRWQVERGILSRPAGEPSKWLTLHGIRVLDWWDAAYPTL